MSATNTARYCPACRRHVLAGHEDYVTLWPCTPPPWRAVDALVAPVCPECGKTLGPTVDEMMAEARAEAEAVEIAEIMRRQRRASE